MTELPSNGAEKFRCNAQVGGQLLLRDLANNLWVFPEEILIAFRRRFGEIFKHPDLFPGVSILHQDYAVIDIYSCWLQKSCLHIAACNGRNHEISSELEPSS